ncbi:C-signal-like [Oculina patagonica]
MAAVSSSSSWPFKSIFITGCNRGIGLEFISQFLSLPNPPEHVFATCRSLERASELKSLAEGNKNLHVMEMDMNDFDSFSRIVSEVDKMLEGRGLDLLINSAGVMDRSKLDEVTAESMLDVYKTNAVAPLMLTKAFLPLLRRSSSQKSSAGSAKTFIVNISSGAGSIAGNTWSTMYPYRPSKAALNMITKSLSIDLASDGILAVALHPGWVKTDMGGQNATLTIKESVEGLVTVIGSLDESKNGGFFDFSGKALPW